MLEEILTANIRGRGGAGFPMGKKASFLAKDTGKPVYLVVNADESEPGTFKDREIMFRVPHRLLEGCLITAHAIESQNVFIYIRGEYLAEFEVLRAALDQVRDAGLLGGVTVVLHRGAGAYICGEETALLESLEGKRGQPRSKPPFPAVQGLYASPSLINNVETIATVPKILELGGAEYAKLGVPNSTGTRVFSLSGNVVRGGNYELPLGTSLRELIYDIGGGIPDGRELKAIIPGGSSVPVLTAGARRRAARLRLDGRAEDVPRLRRGDRDRRPLLHGAARPARRAVLHARVVRQVHAVPRGHALDGADPGEDRGRARRARGPRPAALGLRPHPRQVPVPARRRGGDAGRELRRQVPRRVPPARRRRRLPVPATRRSTTSSLPSTSTATSMSTPELVTVVVDDREVQVAKGTGLVETALAAGIEIPVFCYEPRLGPPVGACRMCLVEIEGNPKLQAGCTLTAQDGLVVRTAQTSAKAAEGQNATLEFILVNHPLDCPVCDKGGECPLQDLTFRYGPGSTRMTFSKLTADKPIPISPHIALDRERCILCYRCTRFSESVAEDGELVAVNRGASTEIATFGEEPYRDRFSGNVIELCPVGALTSTRVPLRGTPVGDPERAVGLRALPRRLQHRRDDARREGQADPLAEPPGGRPRLALRQGALRVPVAARGRPHRRPAPARPPARARGGVVGRRARRGGAARCARPARRCTSCSPGRRRTSSRTRSRSWRPRSAARCRCRIPTRSRSAAPLSELARTGAVAEGDVPLDELAPIAELWAKEARRHGANGGEPALRVPRTGERDRRSTTRSRAPGRREWLGAAEPRPC